jgi:hypothetical protein
MMSKLARREYMKEMYVRYQKAKSKGEKSKVLDEFCEVYKCHRKHAIRIFSGGYPSQEPAKRGGKHNEVYDGRIIKILEEVWEKSYYISSQRLVRAIPLWLPSIKKHYEISAEDEIKLLNISAATIDRRLKDKKLSFRKRIYGKTKGAERFWRSQVPIQTEKPDVKEPGWTEIDLVSHSGQSAAGCFAQTVSQTDLLTQWIVRKAILGKGEIEVCNAIDDMRSKFPFEIKGLDSDNGSEFINGTLIGYCIDENIYQTRGRAYKKDDQAHIEQKNGANVRKWVGWVRYDTSCAVEALNNLYDNELWILDNLFMPSQRLIKTEYRGSTRRRYYDEAKTPLDRLNEYCPNDAKVKELLMMRAKLDPIEISGKIEIKLRGLEGLSSKTYPKINYNRYKPVNYEPHIQTSKTQWCPQMTKYRRIWGKEKALKTW